MGIYNKYLSILFLFFIYSNLSIATCIHGKIFNVELPAIGEIEPLMMGEGSALYVGKNKSNGRAPSLVFSILPSGLSIAQFKENKFQEIWLKEQVERLSKRGLRDIKINPLSLTGDEAKKIFYYTYSYRDESSKKINGKGGVLFKSGEAALKFDFRAQEKFFSHEIKWVDQVLQKQNGVVN